MSQGRIAVVIPVFNRAAIVLEAIDSVLRQTTPPGKLIVIDDGSTDGTAAAVRNRIESISPGFPTAVIRQNRLGVSAARNRGAAESGDLPLLAFLDSDDLWPGDYLSRMDHAMGADSRIIAATADLLDMDVPSGRRRLHRFGRLTGQATSSMFSEGSPPPQATVMRTGSFGEIGGFQSRDDGFEDCHLMLRLSLRGRWQSIGGEPVVRRGMGAADAAGQLSHCLQDGRVLLREVHMLKRFIRSEGGTAAVDPAMRQKRIARGLYRAARNWPAEADPSRARLLYRLAMRRDPWLFRAWRRWLLSGVMR